MNITKRREHMLRKKDKEHKLIHKKQEFLTPLQEKILLFLASNYPMTKNETKKGISGNYRSSWDALKGLENKKLIQEVSQKIYRGREYPRYWVTENGILLALSNKLKPETLLRKAKEIYPENTNLHFLIEIVPILGDSAYDMLSLAVVTNGKFEKSDILQIYASQGKLTDKEIRNYNSILKNYPEIYQRHVAFMKQASKNLKDLLKMYDE
jgi:hypothetical protein